MSSRTEQELRRRSSTDLLIPLPSLEVPKVLDWVRCGTSINCAAGAVGESGLCAGARPAFPMPSQGHVRPPQDASALTRCQISSLPEKSTQNVDPHGRTIIRPPSGPPPSAFVLEPSHVQPSPPITTVAQGGIAERPEEPAKYIFELPKLTLS